MKAHTKKALLAVLLAVAAATAQAGSVQNLESSAVLKGTIVVDTNGAVQSAVIDNAAKYGQPIVDMVRNAALQWRFQPVLRDGEPVLAKASMQARVVIKKMPDGNYTARIKGATFGNNDASNTAELHAIDKNTAPHYPEAAMRSLVQGTVFLALQVDRTGHVTKAFAEQVNLENAGPEFTLRKYRTILAKSALKAAWHWKYAIPTTGKLAGQDSWTAHVPVTYSLNMLGTLQPDRTWQTYVPGPYTPAPWVDKPDVNTADALADDTVLTDGAGPTLLTPHNHG